MRIILLCVERRIFQIEVVFGGQSGHGSTLFNNTPGEKLNYVVNKFTEFRAEEKRRMEQLNLPDGNVTSINLTMLKGGVANNVIVEKQLGNANEVCQLNCFPLTILQVIPAELSVVFDIRVSLNTDVDTLKQKVSISFVH